MKIFLTTLKDVSVDMNVDIKDAIKSEVNRWVLNLDYKCDIPVVFCTEGLTFFKKFFLEIDMFLFYVR